LIECSCQPLETPPDGCGKALVFLASGTAGCGG
jgi:hypothetical protein